MPNIWEVYYEQNPSSIVVHNLFKKGREDFNDDVLPGLPNASTTDETIEAVRKMILDNSRVTIREVAHDVDIFFDKCKQFLRMFKAWNTLTTLNDEPDLPKKVLIVCESWVYGYGIETKAQSS